MTKVGHTCYKVLEKWGQGGEGGLKIDKKGDGIYGRSLTLSENCGFFFIRVKIWLTSNYFP